jgi:hypothetical protein
MRAYAYGPLKLVIDAADVVSPAMVFIRGDEFAYSDAMADDGKLLSDDELGWLEGFSDAVSEAIWEARTALIAPSSPAPHPRQPAR